MKRQPMTIVEINKSNMSYSIVFNNIGLYPDLLKKLHNIIKFFATGNEFFFGHYRTDGMNLTKTEMAKYSRDIPLYFKLYGEYRTIDGFRSNNNKISKANSQLIVCRTVNDERIYGIIDNLFHYYLETTFFCPKISWESFIYSYKNYINNGTNDYILRGYADFLFSYIDSGDFSITFDPKIYNPQVVRKKIDEFLNG